MRRRWRRRTAAAAQRLPPAPPPARSPQPLGPRPFGPRPARTVGEVAALVLAVAAAVAILPAEVLDDAGRAAAPRRHARPPASGQRPARCPGPPGTGRRRHLGCGQGAGGARREERPRHVLPGASLHLY